MLQLLYTCNISRNAKVSSNGVHQMQSLATNVPTLAIPMTKAASLANGFDIALGFDFYFNYDQDVKVGDKLTYNGNVYAVQAIQSYPMPLVQHVHVIAQQDAN